MTKFEIQLHHIETLHRRYGHGLSNWELICTACAEVFAGETIESIYAEMEGSAQNEWAAIKLGVLLAVVRQFENEGE